jgi:antitoxin HigA-1
MRKAKGPKSSAMKLMEQLLGGPLTLGLAIESLRKGETLSQEACAKRLKISKSHLCDVEKGRKLVSPERAAKWARLLGYPESVLVQLALQAELDVAGLKYTVAIEAA